MRGLDRGNQTDLDSGVMNDAVKGIEASSLFHCQQLQDEKKNIDEPQRRCCSESLGLCGLPITVPANSHYQSRQQILQDYRDPHV